MTDDKKKKMYTKNTFSIMIEKRAEEENETCLDIIMMFCEENGIDVTDITKNINQSLKDKLEIEASDRNMIKHDKKARFNIS